MNSITTNYFWVWNCTPPQHYKIFGQNVIFSLIVVTHLKSAQDRLVSDVLGVLTSFGSSNIILALPRDPTESIVPVGDPAVKSSLSTQNRTAHT